MTFKIPTLPELIGRAQADLSGAEGLRHSDAQVAARVQAGAHFGIYGHQRWIADQILPDTSEEEMLKRQAKLRPIRDQLPAVSAKGAASFAGSVGAVLDAGTLLQRDDGVLIRVTENLTLTGPAGLAALEAVDAGALGNTAPGAKLKLVSPVLGIVDGFTVTGDGLAGGVDQESIDALRVRVIRSYRQLPHGGNADDYVTWALEVPGVTRAWHRRRWLGPGTVGVFIMRDGDPDPFPNAAALEEAAAYIEAQRPTTAELYVLAPVAKPVVYEIALTPDSSTLRAAVEVALRDLHYREAEPGVTLLRTHIAEAISGTRGERDHNLIAPAADVTAAGNEILTFGGIVWH